MAEKIVVVGSSNTDMILQMDHIPRPGETLLGGRFSMAAGGKGANQAVAAARVGGEVTFVARVGEDMFGSQAIKGFVADGIHVDHVTRDAQVASGVALIFVADDGENSIGVALGANGNLSTADVEKAKDAIASADVLLMQLETPLETVEAAAEIASTAGARVILNPAPAQPLPDRLLKRVSILTPNESEAELLTGIKVDGDDAVVKAAKALLSKGVETVLITLGPGGAFVVTANTSERIKGFKVNAVDSTAAGDVFNGAFGVALAEGQPLKEAVRFANAAAALSVTKLGAQPSAPRRDDVTKFLASHA